MKSEFNLVLPPFHKKSCMFFESQLHKVLKTDNQIFLVQTIALFLVYLGLKTVFILVQVPTTYGANSEGW